MQYRSPNADMESGCHTVSTVTGDNAISITERRHGEWLSYSVYSHWRQCNIDHRTQTWRVAVIQCLQSLETMQYRPPNADMESGCHTVSTVTGDNAISITERRHGEWLSYSVYSHWRQCNIDHRTQTWRVAVIQCLQSLETMQYRSPNADMESGCHTVSTVTGDNAIPTTERRHGEWLSYSVYSHWKQCNIDHRTQTWRVAVIQCLQSLEIMQYRSPNADMESGCHTVSTVTGDNAISTTERRHGEWLSDSVYSHWRQCNIDHRTQTWRVAVIQCLQSLETMQYRSPNADLESGCHTVSTVTGYNAISTTERRPGEWLPYSVYCHRRQCNIVHRTQTWRMAVIQCLQSYGYISTFITVVVYVGLL